jgi:hypothetical protein
VAEGLCIPCAQEVTAREKPPELVDMELIQSGRPAVTVFQRALKAEFDREPMSLVSKMTAARTAWRSHLRGLERLKARRPESKPEVSVVEPEPDRGSEDTVALCKKLINRARMAAGMEEVKEW